MTRKKPGIAAVASEAYFARPGVLRHHDGPAGQLVLEPGGELVS